ncbi:MAG: glycosyl hydrolase [Bacteroidota bacterium]
MKPSHASPENRDRFCSLTNRESTPIIVPVRMMMLTFFTILLFAIPLSLSAQKKKSAAEMDTIQSADFNGLKFRSIGPAYCSGRIADFAVNPKNNAEYFVAVASGHIWKTRNAGTTWEPVFDNYGSYSIGCLAMDPENPNVVWAGTGENNHQRALGYGDGVYRTTDGGKSWKNMGLKESRQIGMIAIDPRNTNVVYVAAEGSAWGPGTERGLYKTTDGGKTWNKVLNISENTGVNNVIMDPRNPDVLYATSEQRRRHDFTKIGGGPESGIWKSTDAGANWEKLSSGLPSGDVGGTGIAISPVNPDIVYAIIEAAGESGGFYRTTDRGASWSKMSGHTAQGQYYNEIYCDPKDQDKVYSVETFSQYTEDAGKTWNNISTKNRHVDDHAMWIDPANTSHYLIGGDGGIYETWDGGQDFHFKNNLPVTQFYRVNVDNSLPFYYVYGGTQDNNSMGGPSRNISGLGVVNDEWFVTNGGDGFWTAVDPTDPNIVYAEAQYGNMVRYDRKSGEAIDIRPEPRKGEDTYKWYWDTPLFISKHSHTRLYTAASKVFRSDDRGNTWQVISDDLTTGTDRNTWPVMGKYWSIDAVAKDVSTSLWGLIVSLEESPVKENLIYAGTDDGLIQVSEDAKTWNRAGKFPGVPEFTFVADILASQFDENVVFAAFDNIKRDDFKPYLLKSSDKGKTWVSIASNLPQNGTVHCLVQDHINPDLLFAGTEFGVFFSIDGGGQWTALKNGLPAISVRDLVIQKRENDLVLATFGRGFYILDNYTPLRTVNKSIMESPAHLFDIKDALMFVETGGKYGQGSSYYAAKNPDFGATFTWWLKEVPKTLREKRQEAEKELFKKGEKIPQPAEADLKKEETEIAPYLIFTITGETGNTIRRLYGKPSKGLNRINWDLRYTGTSPVSRREGRFDPFKDGGSGLFVMPGKYQVALSMVAGGETTALAGPVPFNVTVLNNTTLPAEDRMALVAFQQKVAGLIGKVQGTENFAEELRERLTTMMQAVHQTPGTSPELQGKISGLLTKVEDILYAFNGKTPRASREENPPAQVSINERLGNLIYAFYSSTSAPTSTHQRSYEILRDEFPPLHALLKQISEADLPAIEDEMEKAGVPSTPGRLPDWE